MMIDDWLQLADNYIKQVEDFMNKSSQKNNETNELIKKIASNVSTQWIETHNVGVKQVEDGLKTQGNLITTQANVIEFIKNI